MRCTKPFVSGRVAFGCGQCMPCRFNRRRTWAFRIMLESSLHSLSSCITLTYREAPLSLDPSHLQLWLKRVRKASEPHKLRYFACGEYGDESGRPHFHVCLFGYSPCQGGAVIKGECQCNPCSVVRKTWGYGHVMVRPLDHFGAQYVAGYVVKKMTSARDARLSEGQYPEFARMSLHPGIGADALWDVASEMMRAGQSGELPSSLYVGKQLQPLGRYLRLQLSKRLGHSEEYRAAVTDQALSRLFEEMSIVWELAKSGKVVGEKGDKLVSPQAILREVNEPFARSLEGRFKMRRRSL